MEKEDWIPFYRSLAKGDKSCLLRSTRFIYLELCLAARPFAGMLPLPWPRWKKFQNDTYAVHELIGGDTREIGFALKRLTTFTDPTDPTAPPMITIDGPPGKRVLTITAYGRWVRLDHSTPRVRKYRLRSLARDVAKNSPATPEGLSYHAPTTALPRTYHGPATLLPHTSESIQTLSLSRNGPVTLTKKRREENKSLTPYNPPAVEPEPEETPAAKLRASDRYARAFADGIAAVTGVPCSPPVETPFKPGMGLAIETHSAGKTGEELIDWIRSSASRFAKSKPEQAGFGGFTTPAWLRWLDAGMPVTPPKSGKFSIVQQAPTTGRFWKTREEAGEK